MISVKIAGTKPTRKAGEPPLPSRGHKFKDISPRLGVRDGQLLMDVVKTIGEQVAVNLGQPTRESYRLTPRDNPVWRTPATLEGTGRFKDQVDDLQMVKSIQVRMTLLPRPEAGTWNVEDVQNTALLCALRSGDLPEAPMAQGDIVIDYEVNEEGARDLFVTLPPADADLLGLLLDNVSINLARDRHSFMPYEAPPRK